MFIEMKLKFGENTYKSALLNPANDYSNPAPSNISCK